MLFDKFDKNVILISSDRILLNAKSDSIFITSNNTVGISSQQQIHFDVGPEKNGDPNKHYLIINSPKIQLGLPEEGKNEPVAKADSTVECISSILNKMLEFSIQLKNAAGVGVGTVSLVQVNIAADKLAEDVKNLLQKYTAANSPIRSKITNTI